MNRKLDLAGLSRFGFLTLNSYSMIAVSNAIEVLRMANRVTQQDVYEWDILTQSGEAAIASNGLMLHPTVAPERTRPYDVIFVCGGINVRAASSASLRNFLRVQARAHVVLGALCTGTFTLAEAGLLRGYKCAIHWENLSAIREEFPEIDITDEMFVIDRDRLTCAGGSVPLDMMLRIVEARFGRERMQAVAAQFILDRSRTGNEAQPVSTLADAPPALMRAMRLIERDIDRPLRISGIAADVGLSVRQLERLFRRHADCTPAVYIVGVRLERARRLLQQTGMSITNVSLACGFVSPAHFSTAYRSRFGCAPRDERRLRPSMSRLNDYLSRQPSNAGFPE